MLRNLTTVFLVLFAFYYVSALSGLDYRVALVRQGRDDSSSEGGGSSNSTNNTTICKTSGYVCDPNCKDVYACMYIGGQYKPMKARTCGDKETCLNGNCTTAPNPQCNGVLDVPFTCNSIGTFPDPFNCKQYHMCCPDANGVVGKGAVVTCSGNYSYNTKTTFCDKKIINDKCGLEYPVPLCTSFGQTAALKENPSLFYFCLPLESKPDLYYPNLFACDNGGIYDSKTLACK